MKKIIDVISPDIQFSISEASEVDGEHVLAKVRGEFFVPDGKSRNKRFYPRELWEKQIGNPKVQEKLKSRLMFGTVGHDGELGDKGIREGLISHIMTNILIDNNGKGIGEALVLNTPTGRILNTMLRAGCKLFVSSRANGTFGREVNGLPSVDPDTYELEGWDFVVEPGFLEANPSIAESLNNLQKNINNETILTTAKSNGEDIMEKKDLDAKLVQHIVEENAELKKNVGELTDELNAVKADKDVVEKENAELKADDAEVTAKLEKLKKYEEMGEPEELKAELEKSEEIEKENDEFKELGDSPAEVKESLLIAKKHLKYVRENFGTVAEIKKALTEAINFKKEVSSIGTVAEIKEALATLNKIVEEEEQAKADAEVKELSDETGLEAEEIKEMLKTQTASQIRAFHAKMLEATKRKNESKTLVKKDSVVITEGKDGKAETIVEGRYSKSMAQRLNERFAGK